MLKNYLLVAFRNLYRQLSYSFINVFGLAIGIAATILIMLWVNDEVTYDGFHEKKDHLYKVWFNSTFADGIGSQISMPYPLREGLKAQDAGIKNVCITNWGEGALMTVGEKKINFVGLHASEEFLDMFTFPLIAGDKETALKEPTSIILTESTAKALFGDEDPMNQMINIENTYDLKVTGVMADLPNNSYFSFKFLIPFSHYLTTQSWIDVEDWENNSHQMYMELHPGASIEAVTDNVRDLIQKNTDDKISKKKSFFIPLVSGVFTQTSKTVR
ncbi:MAG: ABC transporter permease [Flammeovirgaceae bacterium]|nr:ABC transporter permease [Flammeovirgaceae bacterium]